MKFLFADSIMPDPLVSTIRISFNKGFHLLPARTGTAHYEEAVAICNATTGSPTEPIFIPDSGQLEGVTVALPDVTCPKCHGLLWVPIL